MQFFDFELILRYEGVGKIEKKIIEVKFIGKVFNDNCWNMNLSGDWFQVTQNKRFFIFVIFIFIDFGDFRFLQK